MTDDPYSVDVHEASLAEVASRHNPSSGRCVCAKRTESWFDRTICPDPCGSMHYVCEECGNPTDVCVNATESATTMAPVLALFDLLLEAHAPSTDDDGHVWCRTCFAEDEEYEEWSWPCRFHRATVKALGVPT